MSRILFPLIVGLAGALILVTLGVWQVQRLQWKDAVLADIEERIAAPPVETPTDPDPVRDLYLPVTLDGEYSGQPLRVLVSVKIYGAGHRLISAFETNGRRVMIDRGYVRVYENAQTPVGAIRILGNLHWPKDSDSFTPVPDGDLWFARDVRAMAEALGTEPVLVIAREVSPQEPNTSPLPVDTSGIPNDHLQYAITWFSLALIWILMTGYWVRRNRAMPQ